MTHRNFLSTQGKARGAVAAAFDDLDQRPDRQRGLWSFLTWSFFLAQVLAAQELFGSAAHAAHDIDNSAADRVSGADDAVGGNVSPAPMGEADAESAKSPTTYGKAILPPGEGDAAQEKAALGESATEGAASDHGGVDQDIALLGGTASQSDGAPGSSPPPTGGGPIDGGPVGSLPLPGLPPIGIDLDFGPGIDLGLDLNVGSLVDLGLQLGLNDNSLDLSFANALDLGLQLNLNEGLGLGLNLGLLNTANLGVDLNLGLPQVAGLTNGVFQALDTTFDQLPLGPVVAGLSDSLVNVLALGSSTFDAAPLGLGTVVANLVPDTGDLVGDTGIGGSVASGGIVSFLSAPVLHAVQADDLFVANRYTDYNLALQSNTVEDVLGGTQTNAVEPLGQFGSVLSLIDKLVDSNPHLDGANQYDPSDGPSIVALPSVIEELGLRGLGDGLA